MKRYQSIGLLSVMVMAVGMLGTYGFSSISNTSVDAQSTINSGMPLLGHFTITETDPQGNIIAYHQGDNVVVHQGENCVAKKVFGVGASACPTGGATYNVIGIGNDTTAAANTQTGLGTEHNKAGLTRVTATTQSVTDATGATPAKVTLGATFTNTASTSGTVAEAGIFNSTTYQAAGLFARQTFSTITLQPNDALTVTWTISIGT